MQTHHDRASLHVKGRRWGGSWDDSDLPSHPSCVRGRTPYLCCQQHHRPQTPCNQCGCTACVRSSPSLLPCVLSRTPSCCCRRHHKPRIWCSQCGCISCIGDIHHPMPPVSRAELLRPAASNTVGRPLGAANVTAPLVDNIHHPVPLASRAQLLLVLLPVKP